MLADHAKAMQRVCFGAEPSEADLQLLGSRERWLIYRDMVRHRLTHVMGVALERSKDAVGEVAFARAVEEWLSTGGPETRYLRHVPTAFAGFVIPIWEKSEAAWVADLARYEIAAWNVRHAPPAPSPTSEFSFDRRPVLGTPIEVLRLSYPVQQTPTPPAGYEASPTFLCVYRDPNHRASTRNLNPIAADLLDAWQSAHETVTDSVQRVAQNHGTEIGPAFVEKLSALIAAFISGGHSPAP